ncbi:MAG: hypothetical protein AB7N61_03690 [Acidimicrobiia bacterium]
MGTGLPATRITSTFDATTSSDDANSIVLSPSCTSSTGTEMAMVRGERQLVALPDPRWN